MSIVKKIVAAIMLLFTPLSLQEVDEPIFSVHTPTQESVNGQISIHIDDDVPESVTQLYYVAAITNFIQMSDEPITIQLIADFFDLVEIDYTKEYYPESFITMDFRLSDYMYISVVTESKNPIEQTDPVLKVFLDIKIPIQCEEEPELNMLRSEILLYDHNIDYSNLLT